MKILVSPISLEEARVAVDLGADIIDIKNPAEGSLGAQPPAVIKEIADYANSRAVQVSATLGDLPFKPGTAALAAFGAAHLGLAFIKVGLYGAKTVREARAMLDAVQSAAHLVRSDLAIVAAGYGDYRSFGGLTPGDLISAAVATGVPVVMLDTAIKDGNSLFDVMSHDEIEAFTWAARQESLQVALAGSLGTQHLPTLQLLSPDIIGVRSAMCRGHERNNEIDVVVGRAFMRAVHADLVKVPRTDECSV